MVRKHRVQVKSVKFESKHPKTESNGSKFRRNSKGKSQNPGGHPRRGVLATEAKARHSQKKIYTLARSAEPQDKTIDCVRKSLY